jgi:hypothetical protein
MLEQLLKEAGEAGEEGVIFHEGPDVLAQAGGSQPTPPPASTPTPTTQPSTPPAGSKPAPAKPAPAKPAPAAPTAAPPATSTSGGDGLPVVTVEKPGLESIGPVSRSKDFLAGVGKSEELLDDLFDTIEVGKISDKVYAVTGTSDAFVIVQLKEREKADLTKFAEEKDKLRSEIAYEKGVSRLSAWLVDRCIKASKGGEIKINATLMQDEESSKKADYQACASINEMSIAGQLRNREIP